MQPRFTSSDGRTYNLNDWRQIKITKSFHVVTFKFGNNLEHEFSLGDLE